VSIADLYVSTTEAVIGHLEDAGLLVADGTDAPEGSGWQGAPGQSEFNPYCIVRRVGGSDIYSDDVTDSSDTYRPLYDVWAVGGSRDGAQQLLGVAVERLLRVPFLVAGYRTQRVTLDVTFSNYSERTEVTSFEEGARFRISLT